MYQDSTVATSEIIMPADVGRQASCNAGERAISFSLEAYNPATDSWSEWEERLNYYLEISGITDDRKKRATLLTFFPENTTLDVRDPELLSKPGDTVLVQELPEEVVGKVRFQVLRTVYPLGDYCDPITGLSVMGTQYRDHVDLEAELAGKDGGVTFDYKSAPPRGWQEGKKDWSHMEPEVKRHDDGKWEPHQW